MRHPVLMVAARALTAAVMLGATGYFREIMARDDAFVLQALVMVGMIVGLVVYTQLCIDEGKRRAKDRGQDRPGSPGES